jgi:hypothetical protein
LAASTDLVIGDADGQHVLIRPIARRHPGLFDHRDANWIECECRIAAGPFAGEIRVDLRSDELSAFLDSLRAMAATRDGLATLSPMEGQLTLTLTMENGAVLANGEAVDAASDGNRLQFRFEIAAASLTQVSESLERTLAVFPVVAAPDL